MRAPAWYRRLVLRLGYRMALHRYRGLVRLVNQAPPAFEAEPFLAWAAEVQKRERDLEAVLLELARQDPDMDPQLRTWLAGRPQPRLVP